MMMKHMRDSDPKINEDQRRSHELRLNGIGQSIHRIFKIAFNNRTEPDLQRVRSAVTSSFRKGSELSLLVKDHFFIYMFKWFFNSCNAKTHLG